MLSNVEIRPFASGDSTQLVELWRQAFPTDPARNAPQQMLERKLSQNDGLLLVATLRGELVGAVIAGYGGVRGWLYHLAVSMAHRRCGIATALVRHAEARLRALGCIKVNLQVRATNAVVVAFYASLGYAEETHISMGRVLAGEAE